MLGYLGSDAATCQAFAPGSWLRTGDLGVLDAAGGLWLRGRLKVWPLPCTREQLHPDSVAGHCLFAV